MIYLASPYSHPDALIRRTRFLIAEEVTARLLLLEEHVYSPIVHCHELAEKYNLPGDFTFWQRYNFDMLRRCDRFRVIKIAGWEESKGVQSESKLAQILDMDRGFVNQLGESVL